MQNECSSYIKSAYFNRCAGIKLDINLFVTDSDANSRVESKISPTARDFLHIHIEHTMRALFKRNVFMTPLKDTLETPSAVEMYNNFF